MAFGKWSNKNRLMSYNEMLADADQLEAEGKSGRAERVRERAERGYERSQGRASKRAAGLGAGAAWDRLVSGITGQGTSPQEREPPTFDALDKIISAMSRYNFASTRSGGYSPFFSKPGAMMNQQKLPKQRGAVPTANSGVAARRGMIGAMQAQQKRQKKPGTLAPRGIY